MRRVIRHSREGGNPGRWQLDTHFRGCDEWRSVDVDGVSIDRDTLPSRGRGLRASPRLWYDQCL